MVTSNQLNTLLDELIDLWISSQISTQNFLTLCRTEICGEAEKSEMYVAICNKISSVGFFIGQEQLLTILLNADHVLLTTF